MFRLRVIASGLTSIVVIACSGSTGPSGGITGTWNLRTINQQAVPRIIFAGNDVLASRIEIRGRTLTLREDGTFTIAVNWRRTPGQGQADTETNDGLYTLVGSKLVFDADCCVAGGQNGDWEDV